MISRNAVVVSVSVVLLVVSVALILLSREKVIPEESTFQSDPTYIQEETLTTFNSIPVKYVVKDSVTFNGAEIHVWTEWVDNMCLLEIQEEYSRNLSPRRLAELVAGCQTQLVEFETPEEARIFESAYADLYISQCGEIFQPLGWGDAIDGECEIPGFDEVTI